MAGAALARGVSAHRVPKPLVLYAVAFLGCAAAAVSLGLALANDQLSEPALRAFFLDWVTLPYIAGGLVAWRCRPDTGFGPLLVAAGFVNFLGTFEWVTSDPWFTIGVVFDLLPPVVFLHVFLAFPGGRPERRFAGVVVAAAYVTAIGLQLARMMLGGAGHNLLELTTQPAAAQALLMIQLVGTSAVCLAGIGVLAARRRRAGRPLRRTRALLVDSFALGLVMIAVLLLAEAFGAPGVEPIRWAAFAVIGIAPVAFWSRCCRPAWPARRWVICLSSCARTRGRRSCGTAWHVPSVIPRWSWRTGCRSAGAGRTWRAARPSFPRPGAGERRR